jgi:hypothetical protein
MEPPMTVRRITPRPLDAFPALADRNDEPTPDFIEQPDAPAPPPDDWVRFELTEELQTEDHAAVVRMKFDGNSSTYEATAETLDVYRGVGDFSGDVGDRGFARFFTDSGRWEIMAMFSSGP